MDEPAVTCLDAGSRLKTVLAMSERTRAQLFTPALTGRLLAVAEIGPGAAVTSLEGLGDGLRDVQVLLTAWGVPRIGPSVLAAMPRLRAIVHAGDSVKSFLSAEVFARNILVSSAAEANAIPVAEFTLAAVIFAANRAPRQAAAYRSRGTEWGTWNRPAAIYPGTNGIVVGVVGTSRVGRKVIDLLRALEVTVLVADPYLPGPPPGTELVSLDELMRRSDVVTLHAPALPSTRHMINAERLARMQDGAVLINTACGSLVDTAALTAELVSGRIDAVLDVTDPEPLPADSPLPGLPNVLLTPHIAGAMGNEVVRLGQLAVSEVERLAVGLPLAHPVTAADVQWIA